MQMRRSRPAGIPHETDDLSSPHPLPDIDQRALQMGITRGVSITMVYYHQFPITTFPSAVSYYTISYRLDGF